VAILRRRAGHHQLQKSLRGAIQRPTPAMHDSHQAHQLGSHQGDRYQSAVFDLRLHRTGRQNADSATNSNGFRRLECPFEEHRRSMAEVVYQSYQMRFSFDPRKSKRLRANPKRGIGFEEAQEVFSRPYWLDRRSDVPEQYVAVGWVGDRLFSVISEFRQEEESQILHLVTPWKSTKEEVRLYEENS
jgi:uncharacterized DUF497 family protein